MASNTRTTYPGIDKEKQKTAKEYFFRKYFTGKISAIVSLTAIITLCLTGLSLIISSFAFSITSIQLFARSLYFIILFSFFFLISFPFSYISSFSIEHRYDFSNQDLAGWLKDQFKAFAISLLLGLIIVNTFYFIVDISPHLWWLWTGIFLMLFTVLLQHLAPVLFIPVFYKLEPLSDEILKEKLLSLAEKTGINVIDIHTIKLSDKTKKANAALTGLGSTRRILLGDTLLKDYDYGEIETVIAHELAHHIHGHISKLILLDGIITFAGAYILYLILPRSLILIGLPSLENIASLPGIMLVSGILSFIISPVGPHIRRKMETEADRTAIELSRKPDKFISTMVKFANNYLSFAYPPKIIEWLEYDHPPIGKRISSAEKMLDI
ncbi:MAG: M48 family metallopeptidase, partial [Elusimicrobiota bacterium]